MDTSSEPLFLDPHAGAYATWVSDLTPRTCLLMHWLANLGAVREPGENVRSKARRFADKRYFLGHVVEASNADSREKTSSLVANGDFDIYVAWLMWLRFQEYVPGRFVLPDGREKVLSWIRTQLRRPELTAEETLGELRWQAERIRKNLGTLHDDPKHLPH